MSDSKSLNTLLLEVLMSCQNQLVFICNLTDRTLQIAFDTLWASMNVGLMCPFAWNHSRHVPSWQFYLHCRIEVTGSPGNICTVSHQVLFHPSYHGTNSMGKQLYGNAQIANVKQINRLGSY
jgi:hypothetical protein